jgi:hypothetical protein
MEKNNNEYDFEEHVHRFAVWTAAKAVQAARSKSSKNKRDLGNNNVKSAIEKSGLREFARSHETCTFEEFEKRHVEFCEFMMQYFKRPFGIAAKIVNIYLKTAVVLTSNGNSKLAKMIHPPIDSRFLDNFCKEAENKDLKKSKIKWTKMNSKIYSCVMDRVRKKYPEALWRAEEYWHPNK